MQKKSVITSTSPQGQTGYKKRQVKLQEQVTGTDGLTATIKYMIVLLPAYCSLATNAQSAYQLEAFRPPVQYMVCRESWWLAGGCSG